MKSSTHIRTLCEIRDPQAPYVIFFHGYGADASDLRPLADAIPTKKTFNYIFPEGPLEVPLGPHWIGRAWCQIDMARLQNPQTDFDITLDRPKGIDQTRKLVTQMIQDLKIPMENIIIGGFSQGGMVAVDQYLTLKESPKAMVLMSTALVNKEEWKSFSKSKKPIPYYMSHGDQDQVLKLKYSDRLHSFLSEMGCKGQRYVFHGVHEIPLSVLNQVGAFLDGL